MKLLKSIPVLGIMLTLPFQPVSKGNSSANRYPDSIEQIAEKINMQIQSSHIISQNDDLIAMRYRRIDSIKNLASDAKN